VDQHEWGSVVAKEDVSALRAPGRRNRYRGGEPIRLGLALGKSRLKRITSTLKRAPASRPSSDEWKDDDYDVLADGEIVGRYLQCRCVRSKTMDVDIGYRAPGTPQPDTRLRCDAGRRDSCLRQELAAGVIGTCGGRCGLSGRRTAKPNAAATGFDNCVPTPKPYRLSHGQFAQK
jgi:hypothetical protein